MFVVGGQGGKLLQKDGTGWRGDVKEVLEGLEDGAGRDAAGAGPVTDDACPGQQR